MNDLTVSVLCHPPHIKFLSDNLMSMKSALGDRNAKVILYNTQADEESRSKVDFIVSNANLKNIDVHHVPDAYPIGESRNKIFDMVDTKWLMFNDSDTRLSPDYFDNLDQFMQNNNMNGVDAIAGNIGMASHSRFGKFEGLLDLLALVGTIEGIDRDVYQNILPVPQTRTIEEYIDNASEALKNYDGNEIKTLQAFNQIIRTDVRQRYGGCDDTYRSADDRELAHNIRANGGKILFNANSKVYHHYNFPFNGILKRKEIHGTWAEKARIKYNDRPDINPPMSSREWLGYLTSIVNPPEPFNESVDGRVYYAASTLSYEVGCLKAQSQERGCSIS